MPIAPHVLPHGSEVESFGLPLTRFHPLSWLDVILGYAPVKALLPVPILLAIAPVVWWFFRDTWRRLDEEAREYRIATPPGSATYMRPLICLGIVAMVLTMQEYYGGRTLYDQVIRPVLVEYEAKGSTWINLRQYEEYYGYCWWVGSRVIGYVLIPLPLWKLIFPKDSLLDMGLRVRGFFSHIWIYVLCLAVVLPTMLLVAQ